MGERVRYKGEGRVERMRSRHQGERRERGEGRRGRGGRQHSLQQKADDVVQERGEMKVIAISIFPRHL